MQDQKNAASLPVKELPSKDKSCCTLQCINKAMTISDIFAATIVTGLGFYKYFGGNIDNFTEVFVPFYLILFGILLICAEMEWLFVVKYFKFLDNYFGSVVVNDLPAQFKDLGDSTTSEILTITLSLLLSLIGFIYLLMFIWTCGAKSQKYQDYDKQLQFEEQSQLREPLTSARLPPTAATVNSEEASSVLLLKGNQIEYNKWLKSQLIIYEQGGIN